MGVTVQVRVVNIQTGQPVPDVEISDPRFDRSPDGMPGATSPAFFVPGLEYGVYRFRTSFPTAGQWALTFQATVSGEASPIYANVVFRVVDPPVPSLLGPQRPSGAPLQPDSLPHAVIEPVGAGRVRPPSRDQAQPVTG